MNLGKMLSKEMQQWKLFRGDHITLAYKPEECAFDRLIKLVGKRVNAYISELRRNENIEAFWVTDMFYDSFSLSLKEKD